MDDKQFRQLIEQAGELTPAQFKQLVQAYAGKAGQDAGRAWNGAVYSVSEQRLADLGVNRVCPDCGSVAVVHNGVNNAGIQRLRCQACGKSFTRFTGTLLEGIERTARYGRHPSKLGVMGAEFATILTAIDSRGFCLPSSRAGPRHHRPRYRAIRAPLY